ncbi:hypothetical protein TWF281_003750 [Arthrobotrys megalospora]
MDVTTPESLRVFKALGERYEDGSYFNENLEVACHCGANTYKFPVNWPVDKKFTDIRLCQCSDCRLQTGNLASWLVRAPGRPFDPESTPETLTAYKISTSTTRYFCRVCSSQLFHRHIKAGSSLSSSEGDTADSDGFWIFTGCLKLPNKTQFRLGLVGFVDKTPDGGLASWLPDAEYTDSCGIKITGEHIKRLHSSRSTSSGTEKLQGGCHCSNIRLRLSRQTGKEEERPPFTFSDNTDLVIPHWTSAEQQPPIDWENPWWIRDQLPSLEGKRFLGGHCTCVSCRTIAGTEVQSWIFVATSCIELILPDGEVIQWPSRETLVRGLDKRLTNIMGIYQSTPGDPGVVRGFCKECGANIFWDGFTRKNLIDLSAGLFSIEGTKEREWIEWWTERVSFVEDTKGRHDIGTLMERGLREWRVTVGIA